MHKFKCIKFAEVKMHKVCTSLNAASLRICIIQ